MPFKLPGTLHYLPFAFSLQICSCKKCVSQQQCDLKLVSGEAKVR